MLFSMTHSRSYWANKFDVSITTLSQFFRNTVNIELTIKIKQLNLKNQIFKRGPSFTLLHSIPVSVGIEVVSVSVSITKFASFSVISWTC